ncbi:MAG: archaetidylserine decarboxylase [Wenzhouxiangella sp.]|jgi:phosphatidylserine decarboxylase|nr:archaetidylserine decarboxylase [Wenzhouxiangella sp.]MDR9453729.1 archaetidylserine decarboxylase [Wenzhouxiangella sp.]
MRPHLGQTIRVWPQYLLPKHALTHLAWWVSNVRWRPFKNAFIRLFARLFRVNLEEAIDADPDAYPHFNAFFTRALKPNARPIAQSPWVAPADGTLSQLGTLSGAQANQLIQAKGLDYTLEALVGRDTGLAPYRGGQWMTIYLAPFDYHRVHMPADGRLIQATRLPGELFSVSDQTAAIIPRLYARNERLVAEFQHNDRPFMVVMVAALMVAGIETVWEAPTSRRPGARPSTITPAGIELAKADEMGRFHWGSTVIVITPPDSPPWRDELQAGQTVRLGQALTR